MENPHAEQAPLPPPPHPSILESKKRYYNMFNAEFFHNQDHINYSDGQVSRASEFIGLETLREGKGDKCMMHDWATIYFEGWTQDGQKVLSDYESKPYNFRVGHYEVSKCWDIAI